jgi:hypothetical protein
MYRNCSSGSANWVAAASMAAIMIFASAAAAQSSWGMAAAKDGTLYFCDIQRDRVWHYTSPDGLTLVLDHNHCHTLVLGYDGSIYGEDVGGETRSGSDMSVWHLTPGHTPVFLLDHATVPDPSIWLVRDATGNSYSWNGNREVRKASQILKRTPNGDVSVFTGGDWGFADGPSGRARMGDVGAMASTPDGTLYLVDGESLRRVAPDGSLTTLISPFIHTTSGGVPGVPGLYNHHLGMAVDPQGGIYVVDFRNRRILHWDQSGTRLVFQSHGPLEHLTSWGWTPTGVAVSGDSLYVMEYLPLPTFPSELIGNPRIRRIAPGQQIATVVAVSSSGLRAVVILVLALLVFAGIWWWRRSRLRLMPVLLRKIVGDERDQ